MIQQILLSAVFLFAAAAQASQWKTIDVIGQPMVIPSGEIRSVTLPSSMNVYKFLIQAESTGRENALFDVIVNGDTKGTVLTPSVDPTYVVTVVQTTNSVQFRSISGGGFRLIRVLAVVNIADENARPPVRSFPSSGQIAQIALQSISLIRQMEPMATPAEQAAYLIPVKASAGRLYAIAAAYGPSSEKTRQAALELLGQIDGAKVFMDLQMSRNGSFDCIVEMLSLRAALDSLID